MYSSIFNRPDLLKRNAHARTYVRADEWPCDVRHHFFVYYIMPQRCWGSTYLPPTLYTHTYTYVHGLFLRCAQRNPGGLSCDRMRGHARVCMTRFSRDSTCKSGPCTDLKRVRTYRLWLNSGDRLT